MSLDKILDPADLTWRWRRFDELSLIELDSIYRARQQVFSVEQQCAYLDADGFDKVCFHLAAWSREHGEPLAYARVVPPGHKYFELSIGRVITSTRARGIGLGRALLTRTIEHCAQAFPASSIRISAQSRLEAFYMEFGFVVIGAPYLEDGIAHTEMLKVA